MINNLTMFRLAVSSGLVANKTGKFHETYLLL